MTDKIEYLIEIKKLSDECGSILTRMTLSAKEKRRLENIAIRMAWLALQMVVESDNDA